ncbi:early nodulin-like protein 14 isoform X1 [Physcomitrium patens]|uniref:early nodulin-like protein 14 isoform X1 n=2 Tax=Physcomitrium patens TaxID=3218 RepID=UPI000D17E724|nr:early nodulin-like protein 1 [Physcomitrium patens]|eukprot:XP_024388430.1 early nodulin-like protein 1 [Physcomitrella patens]
MTLLCDYLRRMAKTVKRSNANMNSAAAAVAVLMLVASVTDTASAKEYTVGGTTGWDYAPTTSFYSEWSNKLRIVPGDKIVFKYMPTAHNVQEVTEADYAACNSMNPITEYQSGNDIVTLPKQGTHYYICGVLGHCTEGGMRMKVTVVADDSLNSAAPAGSLPLPQASTPQTGASSTSGLARRGGDHANSPAIPPISTAGHSAAQISAKPKSLSGMAVLWSVGAAALEFIVGVGINEVNVHGHKRLHNVS